MSKLIIENNYSWYKGEEKIMEVLWSLLRFPEKNYFHNIRYKMKLWDGKRDFFKKETGRFLTGLLPEIKAAIKKLGDIYCEIQDKRLGFDFSIQEITEDIFAPDIKLRAYQVDLVNQAIKYKRGIITSPTGSGKTLMMKAIIKAVPKNKKILLMTNTKDLVKQNYDEIKDVCPEDVGIYYSSKKQINRIICSTSLSAIKLGEWLDDVEVLIVDEIHDNMTESAKNVFQKLKKATVRLVMSATPFKEEGADLIHKHEVKGWIGPILKTKTTDTGILTVKDLQNQDILCKADCHFIKIKNPKIPFVIFTDAVTYGIADNIYLNELITQIESNLSGRSLISVDGIAQGEKLKKMMPHVHWICGQDKMSTRKNIIEVLKYEKEKVTVVVIAKLFNTGINVFIHNLINAAGGKAKHLMDQRIGRGLRKQKDKKICCI